MDTGLHTLAERLVDTDATVRRLAVIDLPYSDEDDIVPLLLPRLADSDARCAPRRSARSKALKNPSRASPGADAAGCRRRRAQGRRRGAGRTERDRSAAPLLPMLQGGPAEVRALAFHAVRALRSPQAFAPAMQSLRDPEAAVRREAVGVLGYLKDPAAIGDLAEVAANRPGCRGAPHRCRCIGFTPPASACCRP